MQRESLQLGECAPVDFDPPYSYFEPGGFIVCADIWLVAMYAGISLFFFFLIYI